MKNSPCYGCQRRSAICHAQCEEYPAWVAELKAEREAARQTQDADAHTKRTIERNQKKAKTRKQVGQL